HYPKGLPKHPAILLRKRKASMVTEKTIKTVHLTNAYHQASGGISTFYREMLNAANRQQREMRLVVPGESASMEEVGDYGRIYTVTSPRAPFGDSRYRLMLPDNYLFSPENPIRRILYKEQPDLIEICDKYALHWLAGLIRKKYIRELGRPV